MAIAAVAHIFVFSDKTYLFVPARVYGKVTTHETTAVIKMEKDDKEKPALLEKKETVVEAPGTCVKESVEDIVAEGGQKVVEEVVLTINQAIEPMHEGMTKIQETFHHISISGYSKEEPGVKVEEHEQNYHGSLKKSYLRNIQAAFEYWLKKYSLHKLLFENTCVLAQYNEVR